MHEYTSVSVSSYEAATLTDALNTHAADGWSVVQIVPAGSSIVAYLSRPATAGGSADSTTVAAATATAAVAASPAAEPSVASEPAMSDTAPVADTAAAPAADPAPVATAAPAPASDDAVPAGWYPDPSGRFELRYWDGSRWTEHVSRAGQQYTDPPVA